MGRFIAISGLVLLLFAMPLARVQGHSRLAPADEYFGHLQMSILGIRNELNRIRGRVEGDEAHADQQLGLCADVENAIEDFGTKYPDDSWLMGMTVDLESIYAHMHSNSAHLRAEQLLGWVHDRFPRSRMEDRVRLAMQRR
ncbi:MAG: hypothetical protein ACYDGM_02505 [Vulcanimicrobiaceae bacterium]